MGRKARLKRERRKQRGNSTKKQCADWDLLIERLPSLRKTILDSGAVRSSCILSTKVLCVLARSLGFEAQPMTVEGIGMNKPLADYTREHKRAPDPEHMAEYAARGARFVVLGARDEREPLAPGMWPGHLVALVSRPGARMIVDLSIDQAHRPAKRIILPKPVHVEVTHDWAKGDEMACLNLDDDGLLMYRAIPTDNSYTSSPDWFDDSRVSITLKG